MLLNFDVQWEFFFFTLRCGIQEISRNSQYQKIISTDCYVVTLMLKTRTEKMLLNTTLTEIMEDSIKLYYGRFKIKSVQSQCSMNNNYCIDSKTYQ